MFLWGVSLGLPLLAEGPADFFEERVRPVLAGICGECHGSDQAKGGFRVNHRTGLLRGGHSGPAVVPGDPEASLMIQAIRRQHEDLAMPPKEALRAAQVAALEKWVASGAPWPDDPMPMETDSRTERWSDHWAAAPVRAVPLPPVKDGKWPQVGLDFFVLARLEARGWQPSSVADRPALVRRAFLDLIGLPPTVAEREVLVQDQRPDAWRRMVDALLARPEYGERWGRHWLDVARYADAKGYVDAGETKFPFAYTYRDYVIGAFNRDLPYDEFVRQQIAADRLNGRTPESLAALGFLTVGARFNIFHHEIIDDRIDVVSRGVLGLSVTCARCHDHKFDPISTADYYSLYSVFANSHEPRPDQLPILEAVGRKTVARKSKLEEKVAAYVEHRRKLHERVQFELRAWAGDYLRYVVQTSAAHRTDEQPQLQTERGLIRDVSAYATGGVHRWRHYLKGQSADDPVFGLWVRLSGLSRETFSGQAVTVVEGFCGEAFANSLVAAAFKGQDVRTMVDVANLYGTLLEGVDADWREALEADPEQTAFEDPERERVRMALYGEQAPGTLRIEEAFDFCTLDESVDLRKAYAAMEQVFLENWDQVAPRPMMLEDDASIASQRIFVRGDPNRPGAEVPRVIPSSLGLSQPVRITQGSGRMELAHALTARDHPLTARVMVNRVWAWHFGQGLVRSPSDFGTRSLPPSHPDLLDYLASEFIRHGWSVKWLHQEILGSATWQQASMDRPELRAQDAENRLLWRQNRRRMEFEVMRDSMLFVSGELEMRPGGVPVRLPPDGISNRFRTVYSFIDRERLENIFRIFDFPSPELSVGARSRTTVPQQALFLFNSPFVLHLAKAIALRVTPHSEPDAAVAALFRFVLARDPEAEEVRLFGAFLRNRGSRDSMEAGSFEEALAELAQILMLSNEFLFVD